MTATEGREAAVCANCGNAVILQCDGLWGCCTTLGCEKYYQWVKQPAPAAPPPAAPPERTWIDEQLERERVIRAEFPEKLVRGITGQPSTPTAEGSANHANGTPPMNSLKEASALPDLAVAYLAGAKDERAHFGAFHAGRTDGEIDASARNYVALSHPVAAAPSDQSMPADYDDYRLSQEISGRATRKTLVELRAAAPSGARETVQQQDEGWTKKGQRQEPDPKGERMVRNAVSCVLTGFDVQPTEAPDMVRLTVDVPVGAALAARYPLGCRLVLGEPEPAGWEAHRSVPSSVVLAVDPSRSTPDESETLTSLRAALATERATLDSVTAERDQWRARAKYLLSEGPDGVPAYIATPDGCAYHIIGVPGVHPSTWAAIDAAIRAELAEGER